MSDWIKFEMIIKLDPEDIVGVINELIEKYRPTQCSFEEVDKE